MRTLIEDWFVLRGVEGQVSVLIGMFVQATLLVVVAFVAHILARRIVVKGLERIIKGTDSVWDDLIVQRRVLHRLGHLAPALVIYLFSAPVFEGYELAMVVVRRACLIYMVSVAMLAIDGVLNAVVDVLRTASFSKDLPVKSVVQVLKLIVYGVATIAVVSLLIGQSPSLLLGSLGAMTAVLMLVFKDPLLGLVAGVQLSANRMLSRGDWIEMPEHGADGDVLEVGLTTVKIQNWDKTITTIPTYALITESFKNWRGMSESGGRRIKRAINVDMGSIKFCNQEMLTRFSKIKYISEYIEKKRQDITEWNSERQINETDLINGRHLTNVGTFRAYIVAYLRHHPMIRQDMTFIVRHLDPTEHGLPIEIYVFSQEQEWAAFEAIQSDILDHVLAIAVAFDLRVYQRPAGGDMRAALNDQRPVH